MYRLIQDLSDQNYEPLPAIGIPPHCVFEDAEGFRGLMIPDPAVHIADGTLAEVQWLLRKNPEGGWLALRAEDKTSPRLASLPWVSLAEPPGSYLELLPEQAAAEGEVTGFVHVHLHSEYSGLDGLSMMPEIMREVTRHGQQAVAVSDHGNVAAHPELSAEAEKSGVRPIFGLEAYLVEDRHRRGRSWWVITDENNNEFEVDPEGYTTPEERAKLQKRSDANEVMGDYQHITLWAMNDKGLRNLWAMSTESYREGFYRYPRLDYETLERLNEGVMASTGCLRGPLAVPFVNGDEAQARLNVARLHAIFEDRLYIEIHTNQLEDQVKVNEFSVALGQKMGIPLVAAVDSHYPTREDQDHHRAWLAVQTNKSLSEDGDLFAGQEDYHIASEEEVRQALAYLGQDVVDRSIANTAALANRCTARLVGEIDPPVFSKASADHPDPIQRDIDRMIDMCLANWDRKITPAVERGHYTQEQAEARFEREVRLLIDKQFCGYHLVVADYVNWAKENGCLVGPARGSGGASIVAYLLGITELDPLRYDLLYERFLNEGRKGLPDYDVDFPTVWREPLKAYIVKRWGEDHTLSIGTTTRVKAKAAFDSAMRVLKETDVPLPTWAEGQVFKAAVVESTAAAAGTEVTWEKLVDEHQEVIERLQERYPQFMAMVEAFSGRVKSYGKHPAGVVVSTGKSLMDLPVRTDDSGHLISQFDFRALEDLGYVKFDLLTIRNLDTIQETMDRIEEAFGIKIDPYAWQEEYEDPQVWEELSEGNTLGVFQMETKSGTRLVKRYRPESVEDLAAVTTLVRPGPMRAGLTDIYLRRKDGQEEVSYADSRLEEALGSTWGVPIYQEQVMAITMEFAGYDAIKADEIRKILGKKEVNKVAAAGVEFVEGSVANGIDRAVAEHMWSQLAEFAKYCVSGDTEVSLAGGNEAGSTVTAADLYRRINAPLLPPVRGRTASGNEYRGPCVVCGTSDGDKWTRGACQPCYVWRQKFQTVSRGVRGLTVEADGRVRPARILMVHKHAPAPLLKVTLEDGKSIRSTGNHQHLGPSGLVRADALKVGDELLVDAGYEVHRYGRGEYNLNAEGEDGGFGMLMAWTGTAPQECEECGHDGTEHRLERAHLDGDRSNNLPSNLRMLCVSCHKKHDYAYNGRRRRWGKGHPTRAVKVVSIEPDGTEDVYSVVMDDPHIWIANGIATANSFNASHATAYAVVAYWTAWLKIHFPVQFLTSALSTADSDRFPEFVEEARRLGYAVLPPDINVSGVGFTPDGIGIRYGLAAVPGVGVETAKEIIANRPYRDWEHFRSLVGGKGSKVNHGHIRALAKVGAFDGIHPNRKALELELSNESEGMQCVFKDPAINGPNGLPCTFDWENEVDPPMVSKGRGKSKITVPKPPPARCTKACRNYTAPVIDPGDITNYTKAEIRGAEKEVLGVWLSSTPFDRIPKDELEQFHTAFDIEQGPEDAEYAAICIVAGVRQKVDRNGNPFAFLTLNTQQGTIDAVCFSSVFGNVKPFLRPDSLVGASLLKTERGIQTLDIIPID